MRATTWLVLAITAAAFDTAGCSCAIDRLPNRDSGGGDGARSDGSASDGASGDGSDVGACAVSVSRVTPPIVLQGGTHVSLHLVGTGFTASTSVTINGMPAPIASTPAPSATDITVTPPDAAFIAVGTLEVMAANAGCPAARTSLIVRNPTSLASAGWPRHHHDNQNSSATAAVVAAAPTLRWSRPLGGEASGVSGEGGGVWSQPVVAPDPAHLGDEFGGPDLVWQGAPDGTVWSFAADGTVRWHYTMIGQAPYGIDSVPAARADGSLYVGISDANSEEQHQNKISNWVSS